MSDYETYLDGIASEAEAEVERAWLEINGFWFGDLGIQFSPPAHTIKEEY